MTFAQPLWFVAFAVLPLLALCYFLAEKKSVTRLRLLVAPKLRETLLNGVHRGKRLFRFALHLSALGALIVALARPQSGFETQEIKRKGRDVVVAIDTSKSMLSDDVSPNRLGRAKLVVQDLIRALEGDRLALVAFAGSAFLQAPLTIDYSAVEDALAQVDTNLIPKGGTNISEAIRTSIEAFGKAEGSNKAIILITDGEDLEPDAIKAAEAAKEQGIRIFTVGVGSTAGTMIPIEENGTSTFVRDDRGQFVKSKLDEARLQEIARATDGFYVHLENGSNTVQTLLNQGIRKLEAREGSQMTSRRPIERYQWPLGLAIVLFILAQSLGDRRRKQRNRLPAGIAALLTLTFSILPARAGQNAPLFDLEKHSFNDGFNEYHGGKLDDALTKFADASTSTDPDVRKKAEYNAANTLFRIGADQIENDRATAIKRWKEAITHYDQALKVDPKYPEAKANRDAVEKLLKDDEKKQQDQKKRDQDKKDNPPQNQQNDPQQKQKQQPNQQKQDPGQQQQKQDQGKNDSQNQGQPSQKPGPGKTPQNDPSGKNQPDQPPQSGKNQQQPRSPDNPDQKGQPSPSPSPGEKKEGELKTADSGEKKEPTKEDQNGQAGDKPEEAKDGQMSKEQARALIEAMKSEEQRVNFRDQNNETPTGKDW